MRVVTQKSTAERADYKDLNRILDRALKNTRRSKEKNTVLIDHIKAALRILLDDPEYGKEHGLAVSDEELDEAIVVDHAKTNGNGVSHAIVQEMAVASTSVKKGKKRPVKKVARRS